MKTFLTTVLAAGAAGGFVGWVLAQTVGEHVKLSPLWAIPAFMLLGAGASLIGIVLANPARDDVVHAVAFAFLCGVFWQPVFKAGAAYVERLPELRKEEKAAEAAGALDQALGALGTPGSGSAASPAAVEAAGAATADLLVAASRVRDADLRAAHERRAAQAVAAIAGVAAPPEVKVEALADVGRFAVDAGQTTLAVETVKTIGAAAAASRDERTSEAALRGLATMRLRVEASDNVRLRGAVADAIDRVPAPTPHP